MVFVVPLRIYIKDLSTEIAMAICIISIKHGGTFVS